MVKLLVSAPGSGHGKTVLTCALLSALARRGLTPCAFKCGPDCIDPQFHRAVPGVESRNLDLFLMGGVLPNGGTSGKSSADRRVNRVSPEEQLQILFRRWTAGHASAVCEGAMGLYDGLGGVSDRTSAWHIARTLDLHVLLSVRAGGAALTLAAVLRGLRTFRDGTRSARRDGTRFAEQDGAQTAGRDAVRFAGVILNGCTPSLCRTLAPVLEREAGLPVLGCLPPLDAAAFPARHLGLVMPGEIADMQSRLQMLGETLEANADLNRLLDLCGNAGGCPDKGQGHTTAAKGKPAKIVTGRNPVEIVTERNPVEIVTERKPVKIAAARDEAFCFLYPETLEALEQQGAELCFFSPLRDTALPPGTSGLYLPGGYPELCASALAENGAMHKAIAEAVRDGLPTVAEGGGFLYLGTALRDASGTRFPMAGVLPGEGVPAGRLVRFGYAYLCAEADSLLFRAGERIPAHAFHHWDSTENGTAFQLEKPDLSGEGLFTPELPTPGLPVSDLPTPDLSASDLPALDLPVPGLSHRPRRAWREGFAGYSLYAGFPQLYFAGCPALAVRFVDAAARYGERNT